MKSVCICSSQRFKAEVEEFSKCLKELGAPVVFEPNFKRHRKDMIEKPEAERLQSKTYAGKVPAYVYEHFNKLRKADVCYVYNKDGYAGINTTLEIGFAHALDRLIYAYSPELEPEEGGEICRDILFTEIVTTPEELFHKLSAFRSESGDEIYNEVKQLKEEINYMRVIVETLQNHLVPENRRNQE